MRTISSLDCCWKGLPICITLTPDDLDVLVSMNMGKRIAPSNGHGDAAKGQQSSSQWCACAGPIAQCAGGLPLDVLDAALASAFATCRQNISALERASRSVEEVCRPPLWVQADGRRASGSVEKVWAQQFGFRLKG